LQIFKEAQELLPGGVNSPVRAFRSVGGQPIVFDRVKGAYAYDVDGNRYIDYVGSWGPAIVGHANDEVNDAVIKQLQKGASFGAPCELEVTSDGGTRVQRAQDTKRFCWHVAAALF
jgi:glutamate-1-semialdehyde 2,1-aminomutase